MNFSADRDLKCQLTKTKNDRNDNNWGKVQVNQQ